MTENKYKSYRFVKEDGKARWVIVNICGDIINRDPKKDELQEIKRYLSTRESCKLPKEEKRRHLLDLLRYFNDKNGRTPNEEDIDNDHKYPVHEVYRREFGCWNNAIREAGFLPRFLPNSHLSREEKIERLQEWVKENGRVPKASDLANNPKYPCFRTYVNEFGTWNDALIDAGLEINKEGENIKGRQGEIQTISEFKTEGAIDLSGQNRQNSCDGICPKGEKFDTKSSSLTRKHGYLGWQFGIKLSQLEEADYIFLRAYEDTDFTKPPSHKWRIPIDFIDNRTRIFIYKYNKYGLNNVENMRKYEI